MSGTFEPGDAVVYRPHPGAPAEDGEVVRSNEHYVFVRYHGDRVAKATRPDDLERSVLDGFT